MRDRHFLASTCGRRCSTSPDVDDVQALVVVDEPSSPQRPEILQTMSQGVRGDYVRAARALGRTDVDVVLLQHEYGIFGGTDGEYVLSFARGALAAPRRDVAHGALVADAAPAAGPDRALRRGRARDRDDRDGQAAARRARRVRRGQDRRRPARCADAARRRPARARCRGRAPRYVTVDRRRLRADGVALRALDLRADLSRARASK